MQEYKTYLSVCLHFMRGFMNVVLPRIGLTLLVLSFSAIHLVAQEAGRVDLKPDVADKGLSISQYEVKTEALEGGGIRITYQNPKLTRGSWINITKKLDKPMVVSRMGFELKVAGGEDPIAGIIQENGKIFTRKVPGQGAFLSEYEADFSGVSDPDGAMASDAPVKAVTLTFWVLDEEGEKTIELKNWWIE